MYDQSYWLPDQAKAEAMRYLLKHNPLTATVECHTYGPLTKGFTIELSNVRTKQQHLWINGVWSGLNWKP